MDQEESEKTEQTQSSSTSGSTTAFSGIETQARLDYLKEKIEKYESRMEKIKDDLDKKIDDSKIRIIETLGIFVALFTFISINFQVFKSYKNPVAISGLILILLGSLTTFITILDFLIINGSKKIKEFPVELLLLNLFFLVAGFILFVLA